MFLIKLAFPQVLALLAGIALMFGYARTASAQQANTASAKPSRPNVLVIFIDDLGYGELGCQGNPQIPTPHIDSLAKSGVRCTSGYVTASYCSPSRAGLMTGQYQTRFGHELNPVGKHNLDPRAGLPLSQQTIANLFHDHGYATGLVGKWHLGGRPEFHPEQRGFDEFYGFLHEGHFFVPPPYDGVTSFLRKKDLPDGAKNGRYRDGNIVYGSHLPYDEPPYDDHNPVMRGEKPLREEAYLTDAFTREACGFIDRHQAEPFFLYLAYNAVHSPMQGADAYMDKFDKIEDVQRRVFAAMLANCDDSVGAILTKLRELKLEENTLIFCISDNGGPTLELTSSNLPLRGGKGSLYEGGIRVPFLIQWKAGLPEGIRYDEPVLATDVFATAAAAAGIALPKEHPSESVNLLPYLRDEKAGSPHDLLYWRMGDKAALRKGDWKIARHGSRGQTGEWELYNLSADLGESINQAQANTAKLDDLVGEYEKLDDQMVPPVWTR